LKTDPVSPLHQFVHGCDHLRYKFKTNNLNSLWNVLLNQPYSYFFGLFLLTITNLLHFFVKNQLAFLVWAFGLLKRGNDFSKFNEETTYMQKAGMLSWIMLVAFAFCACVVAFGSPTDDERDFYENRRVARITVTRGDVQIRRAGSKEWEEAAPNVPLMEGDRLATGDDSRLEIQFNNRNYLRVDEYSLLQIVTLRNEGIALSLPEGAVSLRLSEFNRDKEYFEIDAPSTTVSARKEGLYRIDAPREQIDREVLVTVTGGGEARVYTASSGFSIRNGRQARVFLAGDYAGEFELIAARSISDDFDRWSAEREEKIARRRADYAYYDSQIHGADELYDYGDWVYTNDYGYVWRPNRNAVASYRDWSPYRYGHWRYLPSYGWTWIADEPWGWATSHYGRWVYINGYWNWCPYDSYRSRRIYWQPALAIFVNIGRNVCWYPMPYYAGYKYVNRSRTVIYNTTIINNNPPAPLTGKSKVDTGQKSDLPLGAPGKRDLQTIYAKAVTGVPIEEFGTGRGLIRPIAYEQAKGVLDASPIVNDRSLPTPPRGKTEMTVGKDREIVGKRDSFEKAEVALETGKIGAAVREKGVQLDERLRDERIFKGRVPTERGDGQADTNNAQPNEKRSTGVFDRQNDLPIYRPEDRNTDTKGNVDRPTPRASRPPKTDEDRPIYRPEKRDDAPVNRPEPQRPSKRDDDNDNRRPPIYSPPQREEQPRYEPPRREEPRYEPPPRREEPRNDPPPKQRDEPRPEPPKKEEPRPEPPRQKEDAPPGKPGKDGRRK
jgi:hypothetical protein